MWRSRNKRPNFAGIRRTVCPWLAARVEKKPVNTSGYVMSVQGAFASGIPGLRSETWGTHRGFPGGWWEWEILYSCTGLRPYVSQTDGLLFLKLLFSEYAFAGVTSEG
jgi:hypothetical protein